MKKLKYVLLFLFGVLMMGCAEENIMPREDEDDPIVIPPPPPPPPPTNP